jgi:hypothetical protein
MFFRFWCNRKNNLGNELLNSPIMEATQWVEIDVQHQIATEQIMYKETTIPSNMHQMTTQISSQ